MTLTTHAVVGGLVGALAHQNLGVSALVAFASHFLIDMIPHWDYELSSVRKDFKNPLNTKIDTTGMGFVKDVAKTGIDAILGIAIVSGIFAYAPYYVLAGAVIGAFFGILPDALQFAYWKIRKQPLIFFQRFHNWIQSSGAHEYMQGKAVFGIAVQLAIIVIVILLAKYINI